MKAKPHDPQYLLNRSGRKAFVVLPVREYEEMLDDLHDLAVVAERREEPRITLEQFEEGLKANGRL
jgi:hypothetical protein